MKRALFGVMLAVLLVGVSSRAFATTTDALQISSGGLTATISDNGTCSGTGCALISNDLNLTPGTDTITGSINGWNFSIVSGTSQSPGLIPIGLGITSLNAFCTTASCTGSNALDIQYSDMNFASAPSAFSTSYSGTIVGSGSTIESAFFSTSNVNFAKTTSIGTVGPFFAPSGAGTVIGGVGAVAPYSLTLDQTFSGTNTSFIVGGNVTAAPTAAPEPASLTLVGTGLIGLAGLRRRKLL